MRVARPTRTIAAIVVFTILATAGINSYSASKMDLFVCQAYQDSADKLRCYEEIANRLKDGEDIECIKTGDDKNGSGADDQSENETFNIPSDPGATYTIFEKSGFENAPVISVMRQSSAGVSYSKRIFNCQYHTAQYLASGPTRSSLNESVNDVSGPVIQGSIAWYLMLRACARD